jgi:nucleotide-binding universal stress UspA family protein
VTWYSVILVIVVWALIGIVTVLLVLHRRGHRDPVWYLLGAILGPFFIPIALERAKRTTTMLERTTARPATGPAGTSPDGVAPQTARRPEVGPPPQHRAAPPAGTAPTDGTALAPGTAPLPETAAGTAGLAILVGVDGSAESDQAVRDAARLVAAGASRVVLAAVVDSDAAELDDDESRHQARELLTDRVAWLPAHGAEMAIEVAAGPPAQALLDLAEAESVDILVVGRRGRGLSRRLIGSVAQHVTSHSTRPVLLASPPAEQPADRH